MKKVVFIDMGHSSVTPGKGSPDGSFKEWKFNRKLGRALIEKLKEFGVDARPTTYEEEDGTEVALSTRASRANVVAKELGSRNVLFVSIHANAAGNGSDWMNARGWSVYISKNASTTSKQLANHIFDEHSTRGFRMRRPSPNQKYYTENFTVLTKTVCPAVLTESLFYDNKDDLALLQSEEWFIKLLDAHVAGIMRMLRETN